MSKLNDYAVYRGDEFITLGTIHECAAFMNVKVETIYFWSTPTYHKRIKNHNIATIVIKLGDENETTT